MSGRYLLDTNIVLALFAADESVMDKIEIADEVFIPSQVIGEMYYVAHQSARPRDNTVRVTDFSQTSSVLVCDAETGRWYGIIKDLLRQKNTPIPENDIWIAALALQYGLTLVTRDPQFGEITNLRKEIW
jgi:tRNA(fMet)-specific endonuclease VapC